MSEPLFKLSQKSRRAFSRTLLDWFAANARPLPWRQSYDPYAVWISEIMLQQTQMERGVVYFERWMRIFPTLADVAAASEEAVLKAWEGLGYYSRARNLRAAAKLVMERHDGVFPSDLEAIRALPGIGDYTAGAVASIAHNAPEPAVDANVLRLFSRLCDIDVPLSQNGVKNFVTATVRGLMPAGKAREFTQALMEFGSLVCGKSPACAGCPLSGYCEAYRLGTVAKRPKPKRPVSYSNLEVATGLLWREGRVFIQKRPPYGVWAGLWEFPGGCLEDGESPEQALVREFMEETEIAVSIRGKIAVVRHGYTTCRVVMHGYFCDFLDAKNPTSPVLHAATEGLWVAPAELAAYTFPAGHRKLIDHLRRHHSEGFA